MDISKTMPGIFTTNTNHTTCSVAADICNFENPKSNVIVESRGGHLLEDSVPDVPDMSSHSQGMCADFLFVDSMLNHLAKSQHAPFKSQQVGDPDLDFSEKKEIARDVLKDNPARFLEKFGDHLLEDHLDYFSSIDSNVSKNYEIDFHIRRLKRFHSKSKSQIDVRNRRFEALKKLVQEGVYFSEEEMKKRNPLMYEQLVGQFLTVQEREERFKSAVDRQSRSYVVHLMGQIEDHYVNCLKKQQQDDENDEELDTSDEEMEETVCVKEKSEDDVEEFDSSDEDIETLSNSKTASQNFVKQKRVITDDEKDLLREEFVNNMYESFLEGKDVDFDYSTVDTNPEYECLTVRSQDEEERYFDSETPELVKSGKATPTEIADEDEDELDKFMNNLNSMSNLGK